MDRWTSGADYQQWMGRWSRLVAQKFLPWLNLPPDLRWLDLCCGSGVITQVISERNSPRSIVGLDLSPEQIAFARQKYRHPEITFLTGSAMALPFREHSFDVMVCGLGLHYLPSPLHGLHECKRALRPGGTVAAYVWDYAGGARFLREFWDAASAVDDEARAFDQGRRFPLCTPEGLTSLFEEAKLQAPVVHAIDIVTRFASFDDYWEPLLTGQGSAPNYLATRNQSIQNAIRERLRSSLPKNAQGGIDLPARAWAVRAERI
jgi:SAM-dependent methyltransferase